MNKINSNSQTKKSNYSKRLSNKEKQGFHQRLRTHESFFANQIESLEDYAIFTTDRDGNVSS